MKYLPLSMHLLASSASFLSAGDQSSDLSAYFSPETRALIAKIDDDMLKILQPTLDFLERKRKEQDEELDYMRRTLEEAKELLASSVELPEAFVMDGQLRVALGKKRYEAFIEHSPSFCTEYAGRRVFDVQLALITHVHVSNFESREKFTIEERMQMKSNILKTFAQHAPKVLASLQKSGDIVAE